MALLYAVADGSPQQVPDEQVAEAIASGKFGFRRGDRVLLADPASNWKAVSAESVADAFRAGYTYVPASEREQRAAEEKFGGPGGAVGAAAVGAARGLTLGLSDPFLKGAGVPLEELKAAQPGISTGFEIGGAIAPALATGGESLAAKALGATPAAGVGRLGAGVTAAARTALGEAPAGAGLFQRAVRAAAPAALGGATEGAIWGGSQQAVEDYLGDKGVAMERILPAAGIGALFGGSATGLFGAAGVLAKEAATVPFGRPVGLPAKPAGLEGVVQKLQAGDEDLNFVGNFLKKLGQDDKAEAVSILTRMDAEGAADRALAHTPARSRAKKWVDYTRGLLGFVDQADESAKALTGKGEWGLIKQERILAGLPLPGDPRPDEAGRAAIAILKGRLADIKATPAKYGRGDAIGGLDDIIVQLEKDLGYRNPQSGHPYSVKNQVRMAPIQILQGIEKAQGFLKRYARFDQHTTQAQAPMVRAMEGVYDDLGKILTDDQAWGKAGAELSSLNALTHDYFVARDALGKVMGREPAQVERFFSSLRRPGGDGNVTALVDFLSTASKMAEAASNPEVKAALASVISGTDDALKLGRALGALKTLSQNSDNAAEALGQEMFRRGASYGAAGLGALGGFAVGGAPGAAIGAAVGLVQRPSPAITALHLFEKAIASSESARRVAIRAVAKALPKGVAPMRVVVPSAMTILSNVRFSDRKWKDSPKTLEEAYLQKKSEIQDVLSDPKRTQEILAARGRGLSDLGFPEFSAEGQKQSLKIYQHLLRTMPKVPPAKFGKERLPSRSDISKWTARIDAAQNGPIALLRMFQSGTLTPAAMETVKELYPREFERMKMDLVAAVEENKTEFSYQERVQLSLLVGEPLDSSMRPEFVAAMQANYATAQEQPPQSPPPQPKSSLRISEMSESESDKMLT